MQQPWQSLPELNEPSPQTSLPCETRTLHDRPKGYSPRRLTADEEAALAAVIIAGPEPERDGVCAWTRADLCRWLEERFAKTYHPSSMTRVLRRMGFSRQKARPSHPRRDAEAQERFKKGGFATS